MESKLVRDISIIKLDKEKNLVISCDSAGGIGSKPADKVKISNKLLGQFIVRVALMEVLASGAKPISVIDTLTVELEPTGQEIISGIKEELEKIGVKKILNGSTEENIPTVQTGLGVTVIGMVEDNSLRLATSQLEDVVVALGFPKVGNEVLEAENQLADLDLMLQLLEMDYIHEILPVGSKGILYEAKVLADSNNLNLVLEDRNLDLKKSAGPSSVLLVTCTEDNLEGLEEIDKPINVVGKLISG
ncbi:AIR synthase related protein [Halanaerobaculum tunisiense]